MNSKSGEYKMATYKSPQKKYRLSAARRQSKPVPVWVIAKTKGKVRRTPSQRHWRRTKLKIKLK